MVDVKIFNNLTRKVEEQKKYLEKISKEVNELISKIDIITNKTIDERIDEKIKGIKTEEKKPAKKTTTKKTTTKK